MTNVIKNKKGFGLIEVVISVSIFLILIGVTISLNSIAFNNLSVNESRWKASLITQNWLERQRNIRDSNIIDIYYDLRHDWIPTTEWNDDLPEPEGWSETVCYSLNMDEVSCPGNFNATFERMVLTPFNPDTVALRTNVTWSQNGKNYSYENRLFLKNLVRDLVP